MWLFEQRLKLAIHPEGLQRPMRNANFGVLRQLPYGTTPPSLERSGLRLDLAVPCNVNSIEVNWP